MTTRALRTRRTAVLLAILLVVGAVCIAGNHVAHRTSFITYWDDELTVNGAIRDVTGNVIVVGGNVDGPSGKGGTAIWDIGKANHRIVGIKLTIYTGGAKATTWGKGIHSTKAGGEIAIKLNRRLVHTIVCDTPGYHSDYWPEQAPVSSRSYKSGYIELSDSPIPAGPLSLAIEASPGAVIDVYSVVVSAVFE